MTTRQEPVRRRHDDATRPVLLAVRGVTKTFKGVRALDGVDLDIHPSEFTAIMGPSGSGKSTLMHCCAALDRPSKGQVLIGDQNLAKLKDKALTTLRRDRIGFVFQSFNLVPTLTAEENILLPLRIARRKPDAQWYSNVIDAVGIRDRLTHRPNELSGGQQQRVAVARALASKPAIVFADEPTGNLDSRNGQHIFELMTGLHDNKKTTLILVTHDQELAEKAERQIRLRDGKVVSDTESEE